MGVAEIGDLNVEKWSGHQKKKFFINKSMSLKGGISGSIKTACISWGCSSKGKNGAPKISKKEILLEADK